MEDTQSHEETIKARAKQVGVVTDLERPWGVAIRDDKIFVVESDKHCITVAQKDGTKVMTIGTHGGKQGQLMSPMGVALTNDAHILIVDQLRLQKFTQDGTVVCSASCRKLDFKVPYALTVDNRNGSIIMADAEKHEIIVVNGDLTPSFSFGSKGSEEGQFNKPRSVAVNSKGLIYVADANNDRVCKFTPEGKFISAIGTPSFKEGQLDRPSAIAIDNCDYLYVTEMINGRIFVYDNNDTLVHKFGRCGSKDGEYSGPQGIAVDRSNGDIIVSDTYNNRIIIV